MSQNELRVLDHWRGVIGARSGDLTIVLEPDSSQGITEIEVNTSTDSIDRGVLECHVVNDWEPAIILGQHGGEWVGSFVVPRLPADVYKVVESSSKLILVEESNIHLQFYRVENGRLVESIATGCSVSFAVSDLCPSAICDKCNRGAQRCKCIPSERYDHIKDRARRALEAQLLLKPKIYTSPLVPQLPLEHLKQETVGAVGVVAVPNDSFEDVSAFAVDHNKPLIYCTCTVQ
jgi:hypothetical protein